MARPGTPNETASGVHFKVHTSALLKEMMRNPGLGACKVPVQILASLLGQVATRASEINDPKLNALMMDLVLYEAADPYSEGFDPALVAAVQERAIADTTEQSSRSGRDQ